MRLISKSMSPPQLIGELSNELIAEAVAFCKDSYKTGHTRLVEAFGKTHALLSTKPGPKHYYFLMELSTKDVEYFVQDKQVCASIAFSW